MTNEQRKETQSELRKIRASLDGLTDKLLNSAEDKRTKSTSHACKAFSELGHAINTLDDEIQAAK